MAWSDAARAAALEARRRKSKSSGSYPSAAARKKASAQAYAQLKKRTPAQKAAAFYRYTTKPSQ